MNNESIFDEDKAIEFIRKYVGPTVSDNYSDDEILFVIDIIWDYYEKNGLLSLDSDFTEEELLDVDKLTAFVKKEIANDDEIIMDPKDLEKIVKGELKYEESLEDII